MEYWAHTRKDCSENEWQNIEDHSRGVAELTREFASRFDVAPRTEAKIFGPNE